jgi:hypothetical protein
LENDSGSDWSGDLTAEDYYAQSQKNKKYTLIKVGIGKQIKNGGIIPLNTYAFIAILSWNFQ